MNTGSPYCSKVKKRPTGTPKMTVKTDVDFLLLLPPLPTQTWNNFDLLLCIQNADVDQRPAWLRLNCSSWVKTSEGELHFYNKTEGLNTKNEKCIIYKIVLCIQCQSEWLVKIKCYLIGCISLLTNIEMTVNNRKCDRKQKTGKKKYLK